MPKKSTGNKVGRPSSYSTEMADAICKKVSQGQALLHVCEEDGFPSPSTVFRWLNEREEFRNKYARAREIQIERMALDALRIADDPNEDPQSRRVRVDTRKWILSKWAPKKYGDKLEVEQHGEQLIQIRIGGDRPTEFINVDCRPVPALGNVIETDATVESETPLSQ
jgi:hypothetical protein